MNKITKIFGVALLLLIMPIKQYGQIVKNNRIVIELATIDNPDFRYCLLSSIANDANIIYTIDEDNSSVVLTSSASMSDIQFQTYYDDLYSQARNEFDSFLVSDKENQGASFTTWKESLPRDLFVLLFRQMMIENPNTRDDNQTCATADPFCTTDVVSFYIDASVTGSCESGPDYGCMTPYIARPPYWFYMKIGVAGTFTIQITNSNNNDLDFCAWGPFTDPVTPCTSQLTSDKIIDCDSPYNSVQECTIPASSQVGQYYLMVITRYSSGSTTVTFSKVPNSGPGETDCGILPPLVNNSGPYCVGETINLTANGQAGATYSWTGPGNFSSNQQNPTRPNCTMAMAGTYTCTITVGRQTNSATTDVVIYPMPTANFTYTSVCQGNPTQFTSTSTTNPSGQQIQSYTWNFGDGQTGSGATTSHTYASAGTYQVTLTVSCGGHCTSQITHPVVVSGPPTANFTYTTVCQGNPTQFTSTASTSPGNPITNYQWNFGDGQTGQGQTVSHTYASAGTYQVTHTVQTSGSCSDSRTQSVPVNAAPTPTATASPSTIIYGGTATLTANAGTQGSFSFHWEPADKVVNPNNQTTQTIPLTETTVFTCTVTNPQGNCTGSTQVTVAIEGSNMTATATADQTELCEGESTTLHAQPAGGTGNYTFSWTPANTLNNANIQNPVATPPLGSTTYTCQVSDGLSNQSVSVTLVVHPNVESDINASICPDETYNFFGEELSQEGTYDHTIESHFGCDSTIHLHLTYHETDETPITDHYCQGETYTFYGDHLNSAGIYYHTLESVHGCDSVIRLNLVEDPSYTYYLNESTCEGGPGYYFDGQYLQPRTEPYTFTYNTVAGCDSIYYIQVDESEYNSKNYNVSICATEYTWGSNGQTYYETGVYYDTLQYEGSCDSTLVLNLELRPSFDTDVVTTSCDIYRWKNDEYNVDMTFEHSTTYTHHYTNIYGCDSEVTLFLTINDHDEVTQLQEDDEIEYTGIISCDSALWSPRGHQYSTTDTYDPANHWYTQSNIDGYVRTYKNIADCDSIVTFPLRLSYTPHPTEIYPADANITSPHWVIPADEFQINSYDFTIWETAHPSTCHWDSIRWEFETSDVQWLLEPDETTDPAGKNCRMYVLNYVPDTVWLKSTVYNRCAPQGIVQHYWFVCSGYGVEDHPFTDADFSVVPNPNNGTMTLNFDRLTGKIDLKVYDMMGNLIDDLTTYSIGGPETMQYDMRNRAEGIYFFVVTGKEGTVAKKVIVRR